METELQKRRASLLKQTYSLEYGTPRTLIDDAKLDSLTNAELARIDSYGGQKNKESISSFEQEENSRNGFDDRGERESMEGADHAAAKLYSVCLSLAEGANVLSRTVKIVENSGVAITHIETRQRRGSFGGTSVTTKKEGAGTDLFLQCRTDDQTMRQIITALKSGNAISRVLQVQAENIEPARKEIWFPQHVSELDRCTLTKFHPELPPTHPGYHDKEYAIRRNEISAIALEYKHGDRIPEIKYTEKENKIWTDVYERLKILLPTHAHEEHIKYFNILEKRGIYRRDSIPQLSELNDVLADMTGFQLRPAAGLVTARDFLCSLAFKVFQSTQYTRYWGAPEHCPEPDVIHEVIGHVPLFCDPEFADFSQELGLASLGATDSDIEKLATLYFYSIEFGLVRCEDGSFRAIGAALLSAYGELEHALSDRPKRLLFDPEEAITHEISDSDYQPVYFYATSIKDFQKILREFTKNMERPFDVVYDRATERVHKADTQSEMPVFIEDC